MPIVDARQILLDATKGRYAVGAFNVTSIVQMTGVVDAALRHRSPLIIQTSVSPSTFLGPDLMVAAFRALTAETDIPACLHLDHSTDVDYCKRCADAGYTNIMIDASKNDYSENIRQTSAVVEYCHRAGKISVEGELGTVSGVEDQVAVASDEAALCDPDRAVDFVRATGVDIFAPAIGTAHGVYKTENPVIDFERLARIADALKAAGLEVPLVVHGGTGLRDEVVRTLVELGGAKFNVSTHLKHVLIDTSYDYLSKSRGDYNPGKLDGAVREATAELIGQWMDLLGSAGKA